MKTLFEWAGGEDAIRRFIDAFYDRASLRRRDPSATLPGWRRPTG